MQKKGKLVSEFNLKHQLFTKLVYILFYSCVSRYSAIPFGKVTEEAEF